MWAPAYVQPPTLKTGDSTGENTVNNVLRNIIKVKY